MKARLYLLLVIALLLTTLVPFAAAHEEGVHVRFAHLSPGAPAVDLNVNGEMAVQNLAYKGVSEYLLLEGREFEVMVVPAGGTGGQAITDKNPFPLVFPEGASGYFTVAVIGLPGDDSFELLVLPEDAEMGMGSMEVGMASAGTITITGAYARATKLAEDHMAMPEATKEAGDMSHDQMGSMGEVSAAFMLIENSGDQSEKLVAVETDVAGRPELHRTTIVNDMAQMKQVMEIEVPAKGSVELKPGDYHVMLMELKHDLMPGDTITLTLIFESGTEVMIHVPVVAP